MGSTTIGKVTAITRYPVKSLQGERLDVAELDASGLEGDRGWGIVDVETGHVLTAKREARLLAAGALLTNDGPVVALPDGTHLDGPGPVTDQVLSAWLGQPVSLRPAPEAPTAFRMNFDVDDPDADAFDWETPAGSFRDLAPVHVLTTAALTAAAEAYPDGTWSPHRFRPTILIDTGDVTGFVENDWVGAGLRIGDAVLTVTMPTIRCPLPTKAQPGHGIDADREIFRTLARVNQQNLGAYAAVATPGTVSAGDTVVLEV